MYVSALTAMNLFHPSLCRDFAGGAESVVQHPCVSEGVSAAAGPSGRAAHGLHGGGRLARRAAGAGAAGQSQRGKK